MRSEFLRNADYGGSERLGGETTSVSVIADPKERLSVKKSAAVLFEQYEIFLNISENPSEFVYYVLQRLRTGLLLEP